MDVYGYGDTRGSDQDGLGGKATNPPGDRLDEDLASSPTSFDLVMLERRRILEASGSMAALTGDLTMFAAGTRADTPRATSKHGPSIGRKRAFHTRTKRGCRVCRLRRVRCDLTKPYCKRCTGTGRKCEGYPLDTPATATPIRTESVLHGQLASANTTRPLVPRAPSTHSAIGPEERQHLAYFQHQTAAHFGGYLEDEFWSRLVLQLTATDDCVLYVTIALGSLHRRFDEGRAGTVAPQSLQLDNKGGASHVYAKAVACLKNHIQSQGWQKLEVTLLCCILCTGFEWLRGDTEAAFVHLTAGLNIFQQWRTRTVGGPSFWSPAGHFIREKLAPFYTRLALQAGTINDVPVTWTSLCTTNTTVEPFQSLQHARDSLCNLLGEVFLVPETYELLRTRSAKSTKEYRRLEKLLGLWSVHFDAYVDTKHSVGPTPGSVIVLRLLHLAATLMLANISSDASPEDTESNNAAFERMVTIAKGLLDMDMARFTIDIGWIAPVYFVAINSRRPTVRQKALSVLKEWPAHEGCWSSQSAALQATKIHGAGALKVQ